MWGEGIIHSNGSSNGDRWIFLSNVNKDYDSLFDFLIREHILKNCSADLRVFLTDTSIIVLSKWQRLQKDIGVCIKFSQQSKTSAAKESELTCHGCGKAGHIRPNCPENPRNYKKMCTSKINFTFFL